MAIQLIIFILLCVGITNIIISESIFDWLHIFIDNNIPFKAVQKLITCPTCLGFWIGLFCFWLLPGDFYIHIALKMFVAGIISSISNKILSRFISIF